MQPLAVCLALAVAHATASAASGAGSGGDPEKSAAPAPSATAVIARPLLPVIPLDAWLLQHALPPEAQQRIESLVRGEHSSVGVAQVRGSVRLHYHAKSEEVVYLVRGRGTMTLGDKEVAMKAGDVVQIPKGVAHAFTSTGEAPAVALSVHAPPLADGDRIHITP